MIDPADIKAEVDGGMNAKNDSSNDQIENENDDDDYNKVNLQKFR